MMPGLQFWVAVASFFNITGPSAGAFVLQAECSTGDVRTLPAERNVNRQMTTESTIYSTKAQTRMAFCVSAVTAPARAAPGRRRLLVISPSSSLPCTFGSTVYSTRQHRHRCYCHDDETFVTNPRRRNPSHGVMMGTEQYQHQQRRQRAEQHQGGGRLSIEEAPLTRRGVLGNAATVIGGFLAVAGGGLGAFGLPELVNAEEEGEGGGGFNEYASPDGSFALRYPSNFQGFSKPLKTHKIEVNFKSEDVKGFEIGVAVDPVRIESLDKFGTPEEVGARVLKVEQGKDGTLDTKLFDSRAEKQGDLSLYTLDYFVESTRGFKHFVAKVTIKDNLLFACTGQAKEKDYPAVEEQLKRMVDSFRVPA